MDVTNAATLVSCGLASRLMVLLRSNSQVAKLKRKFAKDRSSYSELDTSTLDVLLARGAKVNHCCHVSQRHDGCPSD